MIATHAVPMTTAADLARRQAWVEKCVTDAATLPLSFVLDEKKITGIPDAWQPITQQRRIDANRLYPHIPFQRSDQACEVWQFDQPLCGQDCLQAIRLPAAPAADFTIYPQAIDPAADYRFETAETAETCDLSGQDLHRDGFPVMLPARSGVIWFYQRTHR